MSVNFSELKEHTLHKFSDSNIIEINTSDLIFEESVKLNCFYCSRYGTNWKCPPHIPQIDYKKIITEFDHAAFVYYKLDFDNSNYSEIRTESSLILHKTLIDMEKYLFARGSSNCVSFTGGSCKLCKNGCGKEHCNNPGIARIPLEATGVNVVKSAEKYNISISFPVVSSIIRIGLILW